MRAQLKIALAIKKPELLKMAVEKFEARGLTDDDGTLARARKLLRTQAVEKGNYLVFMFSIVGVFTVFLIQPVAGVKGEMRH